MSSGVRPDAGDRTVLGNVRPKVAALLIGLSCAALAAPAAAQTVSVSFSSPDYPVWEGDSVKVGVVLSESRTADTTVQLLAFPLTAVKDVDYIGDRHRVTIPAGQPGATLTIRTVDDVLKEGTKQFQVGLLADGLPDSITRANPVATVVHIQDDDQDAGSVPRLQIHRQGTLVPGLGMSYAVVEGNPASFLVTVSTDWRAPKPLAVSLKVSEDTTANRNYVATADEGGKTMTIHPWQDGASKLYQVSTLDGAGHLPDGAVTVTLVPTDDYAVDPGHYQATVEVADNDKPQGLILQSSTPMFGGLTMAEGGGGGYTVRLASPPTGTVTVSVTARDDGDGDGDWGNVRVKSQSQSQSLSLSESQILSLTFTQDDWHIPQRIDVLSRADADKDNDRFSLVHTASGGGYGGVSDFIRVGVVEREDPPPPPPESVPNDWALKPSGLGAGDRFRLLFLTGSRNAGASDIATYNAFVQTEAAGGHAAIQAYGSQFKVVGSTASVSARDNTMTAGAGVPIHWLNGDKVADDYDDFWDGSWDAQMSSDTRGANGMAVSGALRVWTGTEADGSIHSGSLGSGNVRYGAWGASTNPISEGTDDGSGGRRMLALSPVFEVSAGQGQGDSQLDGGGSQDGQTGDPPGDPFPDPGALGFSNVTASGMTLSWPEREVDHYLVYWAENVANADAQSAQVDAGTLTYTITGLKPGTEYAVIVYSQDYDEVTPTGYQRTAAGSTIDTAPPPPDYSELKATVRGYADETQHGQAHVDRWKRALAGLGDADALAEGYTPMTAAEAQDMADTYTASRWDPIVEALTELESREATEPEPDPIPELSLSGGGGVNEGGSASFTIHADPAPAADVTVSVAVAQSGDYLDAPGAGTRAITLAAGATTASLTIATVNDGTDEADGSVSVSLNAGTGYTVASSNAAATVAVRDDDDPVPEVSISAGGEVTEGGSASFTVTASPAPASPLDVDVTVAQSGDFAASGQTGARTVTVPASGSATLAVATVDDGTDEADGSVSVTIGAGTGYTVSSSNGTATVAVRDDDEPPAAKSCVDDGDWETVKGYYESNANKSPNYGANWYRVLIAYRLEDADRALPAWTGAAAEPTAAFTVADAEAEEAVWSGWTPVREVLECLRDAGRIGRSFVPLVPGSAHPAREGVVRFVNRSPRAGTVRIAATDDAGWRPEPVALRIGPGGSVELTTGDLERGNAAKGLDGAIGTGTGDWRLDVSSDLDLGVRPFARAADGATAAMHGVAEETDGVHAVWTFNPAGELAQSSLLRVVNLGAEPATVGITGIDDAGAPGGAVALQLPARAAVQLTAADLEGGGPGIDGRLGDGRGRWRLRVASDGPLAVMNLALSPFGHLTNLSGGGFPALRSGRAHPVPYLPPASDGLGRLGLVRVVNESARGGEVHVLAHDAAGRRHGPLTLRLGPGGAAQFDSWDLEFGAAGGALSGATGPGVGAWRLEVTSGLDIRVRAYVATPAGSLRTAREFVAGPGLLRDEVTFEEDR